jgi:hypothetical protein
MIILVSQDRERSHVPPQREAASSKGFEFKIQAFQFYLCTRQRAVVFYAGA